MTDENLVGYSLTVQDRWSRIPGTDLEVRVQVIPYGQQPAAYAALLDYRRVTQ